MWVCVCGCRSALKDYRTSWSRILASLRLPDCTTRGYVLKATQSGTDREPEDAQSTTHRNQRENSKILSIKFSTLSSFPLYKYMIWYDMMQFTCAKLADLGTVVKTNRWAADNLREAPRVTASCLIYSEGPELRTTPKDRTGKIGR